MTVIQPDLPRPARKRHMQRRIAALQQGLEALDVIADAYGDGHLVDPADGVPLEERIVQAAALLDITVTSFAEAAATLRPCLPATSRPCACPACRNAARILDNALFALRNPDAD